MLKHVLAIAISVSLISACSSTTVPKTQLEPGLTNAQLSANLASTQTAIIDAFTTQCEKPSAEVLALTEEVHALNQRVKSAVEKSEKAAIIPAPVEKTCPESIIGDKFVLGEVENVFVDEVKASFATRIDTGAESSSLDARNIVLFERNGTQWVRFDVMTNGEKQPGNTFEYKVERIVRIKQDADSQEDRRPVIHAHLKIGKYAAETDLNLTDRSHLDYPLLLGRKFMKDIAVVDVGQRFIHGKK
ncbi:ATP-dependent zinc protease [Shewanella intestini]|uniref:ATP-dependent zinc protease n=1 Tax=Shewanella intestini TaxID=2017544 RepID=A0ABS5I231_9GAMM|nr:MULTISPECIES: ATP-dependent zinc protease [Shewanella]MBR9727878.1 ATP-dependent zinc protease [Shewanella intestini]MRG36129.1 hypothetical protein [Shewanella sp. XMDDZSB0408]